MRKSTRSLKQVLRELLAGGEHMRIGHHLVTEEGGVYYVARAHDGGVGWSRFSRGYASITEALERVASEQRREAQTERQIV